MPRAHCQHCHYPIKTCICAAVSKLSCSSKVFILQLPSETKHGKNTARLIPLAIESAEIIVGEKPEDFRCVSELCENNPNAAVFYPSQTSSELEQAPSLETINTLIFLDGTWRKALKIWSLNPWLHGIPTYRISSNEPSSYGIRKTKQANSLSTLEAVSYVLELTEQIDSTPLKRLQQAMQAHWLDSNRRTNAK